MRETRDDLKARRQTLLDLVLRLAMGTGLDPKNPAYHHNKREWAIGIGQLAAIQSALAIDPEECYQPGGETNDGS